MVNFFLWRIANYCGQEKKVSADKSFMNKIASLLTILSLGACTHYTPVKRQIAAESPCKLGPQQEITIGMTMGYGNYERALLFAAQELGHKVRIKTLDHHIDGKKLGDHQLVLGKMGDLELRKRIEEQLASVDGVLSTGGHDIHPRVWEKNLPAEKRAEAMRLHDAYANLSGDEKAAIKSMHDKKLNDVEKQSFLDKFIKKRGSYNDRDKSLANIQRDVFETTLLDLYFTDGDHQYKPFIGICYGMQMLASHKGIPLTVDIKAQVGLRNRYPEKKKKKKNDSAVDPFQSYIVNSEEFETLDFMPLEDHVTPFTREVYELIKIPSKVPEYHHQNVGYGHFMSWYDANRNVLSDNQLEVLSTSNDGAIAEVIVAQDRPAFGVQFHPERSTDKHFKKEIFGVFLEQACRHRIKRD